jgi:hypothetical protein
MDPGGHEREDGAVETVLSLGCLRQPARRHWPYSWQQVSEAAANWIYLTRVSVDENVHFGYTDAISTLTHPLTGPYSGVCIA